MTIMLLSIKLMNKYTFKGMPIFHLEWVHKYPQIYYLNIRLFEFNYEFKFTYKFLFDDMWPLSKIWTWCKIMLFFKNIVDCRLCFPMLMACPKCKAWIERMMAMLGVRWSPLILKIVLGLSFRKIHCLGHLHCVHDDCENFVRSACCNETFWCSDNVHILVVGKIQLILFTSLFGWKFCHVPPFYIAGCYGRIIMLCINSSLC